MQIAVAIFVPAELLQKNCFFKMSHDSILKSFAIYSFYIYTHYIIKKKRCIKSMGKDNVLSFFTIKTKAQAQQLIRKLTAEGKIIFSKHASQRMLERNITSSQLFNCLEKGRVIQEPFLANENGGGYETCVEHFTEGEWLRVAVCLKFNQNILVITVIKD